LFQFGGKRKLEEDENDEDEEEDDEDEEEGDESDSGMVFKMIRISIF
jgi:hypothetical protein